jgi:transposase
MTTDTLGRPGGPRRRRTIEEKRRIVEETLVPGASVPVIARKYEVNANLVFGWRRLYQQGLLEVRDAGVSLAMLPVKTLRLRKASRKGTRSVLPARRYRKRSPAIEIRLANGCSIRVQGPVEPVTLARVVEMLVRG